MTLDQPTFSVVKLWHDDTRPPPDSTWRWTRTNAEAIAVLTSCCVTRASLDHDLEFALLNVDLIQRVSDDQDFLLVDLLTPENTCPDTGLELAQWMLEHNNVPETIRIHSWNPEGAAAMADILSTRAAVEVREWCAGRDTPEAALRLHTPLPQPFFEAVDSMPVNTVLPVNAPEAGEPYIERHHVAGGDWMFTVWDGCHPIAVNLDYAWKAAEAYRELVPTAYVDEDD